MVQSHIGVVVDVYCSRLLGMLAQTTNFARVNPLGILGSLLRSARRELVYY